jgi:hypothetical protein
MPDKKCRGKEAAKRGRAETDVKDAKKPRSYEAVSKATRTSRMSHQRATAQEKK